MSQHQIISPAEIKRRVADGEPVVIYEGFVLDLGKWINMHPGGRLAVLHMVGRDATDEINIYHSKKAILMMTKHRIGRVELPWTNLVPPIRSQDYYPNLEKRKLRKESFGSSHSHGEKSRRGRSVDLGSAAVLVGKKLIGNDSCVSRHASIPAEISEVPAVPIVERSTHDMAREKMAHREQYAIQQEQREREEGWRDNPSIDPETQRAIILEYRALHEQFKREGLYQCPYSAYAWESLRYVALFAAFGYFLHIKWYITSAMFLGLFWQQIMFTAHDAGHRGITGHFVYDTLIGAFIADFCCGLSIGWWKSSHNVHHLVTNLPEHDPDIQNIPLFSTTPTFMKSILSSFYNFRFVWDGACNLLVPYQKWWYYPVMALARFNLYFLGWLHLCSPRAQQLGAAWWTRPVELVFMCCYWYLFGYVLVWCGLPTWWDRVGFVLTSHLVTVILHVQITLSHWGMPTADLGPTESFPQHQLRTTMDVDCPPWLDWFHGGLQFQAVHHLFPRVPRHNLRRGQELVREFARKSGVKYTCLSFVDCNKAVIARLQQVSDIVKNMDTSLLHG
ncbi:hypothetical protein ACEQ8H_005393 [Pleosporales sp. CAS-2024a]